MLRSCERRQWSLCGLLLAGLVLSPGVARPGVTNPDISVIGQPFVTVTDAPDDPDRNRAAFDVGETEIVFDAALNPYARGFFTLTIGEEGAELEEGFFSLLRGLPGDVALKGGRYRVGFGRLNPVHPHVYPFAERFDVLAAYLPGEESLNEVGVSLSRRFPIHGDFSLNAAVDWLDGDSFRLERESSGAADDPLEVGGDDDAGLSRPAFVGRISGFAMLGEQSALEFGVSATEGTNNVAAGSRTRVLGADAKAKLWLSPRSYLVLQGEFLSLDREDAAWVPGEGYRTESVTPSGAYLYADYNFSMRWNVGASWEGFERPEPDGPSDAAIGAWAGVALLEETTVFRINWRRSLPDDGDAFNTFTLGAIYSMGPHKAHQF